MARTPVSGIQHTLRSGAYDASIASVGATLRTLRHDGRDLVVPFDADELRPNYRGTTLAPWPNRVVDGRYAFGGTDHQLSLTEPGRGHALHGLSPWLDFHVTDAGADHVTLSATIEPQAGYPWRVEVTTTFTLSSEGLTQTVTARNDSAEPAPWGTGPHPYLVAGPSALDTWTLRLPAGQVLLVTESRLIPTGLSRVDEADAARFDYREPRRLGSVEIDHAYTGLDRDEAGSVTVTLTDASGTGVAMTWDTACPWVQIHTADLPGGDITPGHRAGLAVEPMTCAPDAYNARTYDYDAGLVVLEPGADSSASWRIHAL
ncbi:aldose 1-epimerase family protein [Microbacterium sp. BK668]|uniref:aldose 1-epimerase family protein n=1 Tax=Microbacterium sp. BK668 TaxID=2512118 RepID=UPI00105E191D|nr:aldose 1-epimerase family protein [Microbacterium sp. BK668]TDN91744.1 aldose 1-epimerase [Microbacterium sp. BK668]